MRELQEGYGDRADFNVVPAEVTQESQDEIEAYGFTELKHGLVILAADGEPLAKMPGHQFGRDEIEAALLRALSGG